MSLLLDALRRAEQAKEAGGAVPADSPELEVLSFESPVAPPADEAPPPPPLITRDRLPDISQSLDILADDFVPPLRLTKEKRLEPTPRGGTPPEEAAAMQAQSAARRLFEVKEKRAASVSPFYIALGMLGVLAVAGAAYIWYQLQPQTPQASMTRASTPPSTSAVSITESPRAHATMDATEVDTIVPPLMSPSAARQTRSEKAIAPVEAITEAPAPKPARPELPAREVAKTPYASGPNFSKSITVGPSLTEQAYAAFERGDYPQARETYEAALSQDSRNRDALLGLASLDARSGRYESAEARYLKALEADPRDAHAQAGLIALRGQTDPMASESRLKNLLASQPEAGVLNFALGNQYAARNQWSEAQQAYFKAYVTEPNNADYAFNLAVALDHLRQPKVAVDYYQKALALSAIRAGAFNRMQVEDRLHELTR